LNLTIIPSTSSSSTETACDSYTWSVNNTTYTASGVYTDIVGCHTSTLNLTITPSTSSSSTETACDSYTWSVNNTTYTSTGVYTDVVGCHTSTLNLTIIPSTSSSSTETACDSYTWSVNNTTYTASGVYTNVVGCHTSTLNLTITPSTTSSTTETACDSYTWSVNNTTYTASGVYTDIVGCHTSTLNLTITSCNTVLNLTCFIEAYWDGSSAMTPALLNQGQANSSTQCDTITVELHPLANPSMIANSSTALLNTDGTALVSFANAIAPDNYYIVIKHRNALETWSANALSFPLTTSYDFSTSASQAYGNNQVEVASGIFALYSGDIEKDENIDLLDLGLVEIDQTEFVFGYLYDVINTNYPGVISTDLNGDGNVDLLDAVYLETNSTNFIFSQHP